MIAHHRPVPRSQDVWGRVIYATNQENDVSVAKKIVYGAHAKKHDDSPIIHEVCQLNHYAVRSKEEYVWKSIRGNGMLALDDEKIHFQKTYFNAHNLNKETETIAADQYAGPIKEYLASLPTTLSELEARVVDTLVEGYRKSLQ